MERGAGRPRARARAGGSASPPIRSAPQRCPGGHVLGAAPARRAAAAGRATVTPRSRQPARRASPGASRVASAGTATSRPPPRQRRQSSPDRGVEGSGPARSVVTLAGAEAVGRRVPGDQVDQRAVRDRDALGPAGRARGVDDVGEVSRALARPDAPAGGHRARRRAPRHRRRAARPRRRSRPGARRAPRRSAPPARRRRPA